MQLPIGRRFKTRTRDVLRFRSGRELTYMGGFNTGGGTFHEFLDERGGVNHWQTIPHEKFELLQRSGRAVVVEGQWKDAN